MLIVVFSYYIFHSDLTVFSGVADVLRVRSLNVGILAFEGLNNIPRFIQAESGLREISNAIGIGHRQHLDFLRAADHLSHIRSLSQRTDNLIVIAMSDQDQ